MQYVSYWPVTEQPESQKVSGTLDSFGKRRGKQTDQVWEASPLAPQKQRPKRGERRGEYQWTVDSRSGARHKTSPVCCQDGPSATALALALAPALAP